MTAVGATPFFLAAAAADAALMRMLLDAGADPLLGADGGATPLMVAAGMGRVQDFLEGEEKNALEAVKIAIETGSDVNAANIRGQTAMHAAAYTGADTIIQFLADSRAEVDAKDSIGETAWSIAMAMVQRPNDKGGVRVHESTAALLLKLGATPITQEDLVPYQIGDRVGNEVRYMIVGEIGCGGVLTSRARARGCKE
jgi:ankyrin repeat protein